MDPVLQVFQQQQGGSAGGEGFGNFFTAGRQLNLAQQRIDLERKADSRMQREQDTLLPIKAKLLQYDALNRGIEMGALLTDADVTSEMNAFLPKVNDLMVKFMRSPKGFSDEVLINEYQSLYSQNPWAFAAGNGAKIKQGMDAQLMQRDNWIKVLEHDKQLQERGLFLRSFNPKTGDIDIGIRDDEIRKQRAQNELRRLELEEARLMQSGDRNALAAIRLRKDALLSGIEIEGMPTPGFNQGAPSGAPQPSALAPDALQPSTAQPAPQAAPPITLRQVERPATTTTTTTLQKQNIAADQALQKLDTLTETIRATPEAFGLRGVGGELVETIRGQFDPNTDPKISNAREQAGLAFVELADSLRTDTGNMSRYEQERLKELGDTRTWKDYPARALGKAETIRKAVVAKKLRILKSLKGTPDDQLLRSISTLGDLAGLYSSGLIDEETAKRWHDLKRADKARK